MKIWTHLYCTIYNCTWVNKMETDSWVTDEHSGFPGGPEGTCWGPARPLPIEAPGITSLKWGHGLPEQGAALSSSASSGNKGKPHPLLCELSHITSFVFGTSHGPFNSLKIKNSPDRRLSLRRKERFYPGNTKRRKPLTLSCIPLTLDILALLAHQKSLCRVTSWCGLPHLLAA